MRIALVCPRYPPLRGGIETHVRALAGELAGRGCEVEVLTQVTRAQAEEAGETTEGKLVVRRFAVPGRNTRFVVAPQLLRALRGGDYDVVHVHDYVPLASASGFCAKGALVYTPHYHGERGRTCSSGLANAALPPACRRRDLPPR